MKEFGRPKKKGVDNADYSAAMRGPHRTKATRAQHHIIFFSPKLNGRQSRVCLLCMYDGFSYSKFVGEIQDGEFRSDREMTPEWSQRQ